MSIEVPEGFEPVPGAPALHARALGAHLVVTELPRPSELGPEAWARAAEATGKHVLSAERVRIAGCEGSLTTTEVEIGGRTVRQWHATLGDAEASVEVFAFCPAQHADELAEPLRLAVLGIEWARAEVLAPFAAVPFTLDPRACGAPLALSGRLNAAPCFGESREGGAACGVADPDAPRLIAQAHGRWSTFTRLRTYAEWHLGRAGRLDEVEIERSAPFSIPLRRLRRLHGWEVTARARRPRDGRPELLYRAVVRLRRSLATLDGSVGLARRDLWLPAFERLARTLRPKA